MAVTLCSFADQCCRAFLKTKAGPTCAADVHAMIASEQSKAKSAGLVYDAGRAGEARAAFAQDCTVATTERTVEDAEDLLDVVWAPAGFVSHSKEPGEPCTADAECRIEGLGVKCQNIADGSPSGTRLCSVYLPASVGEACDGTISASGTTGPRGRDFHVMLCNDDEASCPGASIFGPCPAGDTYCANTPKTCVARVDEGAACAGDTYASCKPGLFCSASGKTAGTCLRAKADGEACGFAVMECLSGSCSGGTCTPVSKMPIKDSFCEPPS
jgi:hypothetical protein